MPPGVHSAAAAKRTPDWVRGQAAKVGVATAAYVERLLTGRDHIEQGVRSCLGILRLATRYPSEQLEAACVRAMSAARVCQVLLSTCSRAGGHSSTPWPRMALAITATFVAPATTTDESPAPPIQKPSNKDTRCTN